MTVKFLIALSLMLTMMGFFAIAANPCVFEGKEYEQRSVVIIEGKCMMCFNGEWQRLPYDVSAERCVGKL